jgi:hypothetical protein
MTDERSLERAARAWIEEGPTRAPDRPVEAAVARIKTTKQERDLRVPWRNTTMSPAIRLAAAAIVLVTVGVGALALRQSPPQTGTPSASPPTPTASSSAASGRIVLTPGSHTTTMFQPPTTFTVSEGWVLEFDTPTEFRIIPLTPGIAAQLAVCRGDITALDAAAEPLPDVGEDANAILAAVAARTDLVIVTSPQPWALGEVQGAWMDVRNPTSTESALVGGGTCGNNLYPGTTNRFAVMDLADGSEIVVTIFTFPGTEAFIEAMTPIAESLRFATP